MCDMLVHWLIGKWLLEWRLHSIGYVHCAAVVWYRCHFYKYKYQHVIWTAGGPHVCLVLWTSGGHHDQFVQ